MQLMALAVAAILGADPAASCRRGLVAASEAGVADPLSDYPTEKLKRPLALPRYSWSLSTSGVYSGTFTGGGAANAGGATLGVAFAPACNLEIGVDTAHAFLPAQPFNTVAPSVTMAMVDWIALMVSARLRLQPTELGVRSVSTWLGSPLRWALTRWIGIVGLERIVGLSVLWSESAGTSTAFTLSAPLGALFQPASRFSVEAKVQPLFVLAPSAAARVEFDFEALFVPLQWLDVRLTGHLAPGPSATLLIASLGVSVRL